MKLFYYLLSQARGLVGLTILAGTISGLASAALIAVINSALGPERTALSHLGWAFAGACLLVLLTRVASEVLVGWLGQGALLSLRVHLSRRILAAPFPRLQELGAPRLLLNLTEDISTIAGGFQAIPPLCINGTILLGCFVYLGWLSLPLLGLMLCVMVLGVVSYHLLNAKGLREYRAAREYHDALYEHFRGLTQGIKELKLSRQRREAFIADALERTAIECRQREIVGNAYYSLAISWGNSLYYLVIGVILFALPRWLEIPIETLTGYTVAILYIMGPLGGILDSVPTLGRAGVALSKIDALGKTLSTSMREDNCPSTPSLPLTTGALQLKGVTHHYYRPNEDHSFTLGPLDLTIHPGELVFLTGGNGSGKTTLALLLVGLYVPESGEIGLSGEPVNDLNREQYREHFSAVFSDFYLFKSLLGFRSEDLDKSANRYLAQLELEHKVQIDNGVFSTVDLSQGQRKRLALLIAYLEDRPIYVFDEWAADQDPVFKNVFYTAILPELKARGKTVIVITHDDRYFSVADRCIKLESGQLTEYEPADLMPDVGRTAGVYARG